MGKKKEKWRDCQLDPPEEGIKVLCVNHGDFFVAYRIKNFYMPTPFTSHPHAIFHTQPGYWCAIDFPNKYTGRLNFISKKTGDLLNIEDFKNQNPEDYEEFCHHLFSSIGSKKRDKMMWKKRNEILKKTKNIKD